MIHIDVPKPCSREAIARLLRDIAPEMEQGSFDYWLDHVMASREGKRQVPEVVTPIVHMNGDRCSVLADRLEEAYDTIRHATTRLAECAPNGRNFYPEPGRIVRAEEQHKERMGHLMAVMASLEAEVIKLQRENPGRR